MPMSRAITLDRSSPVPLYFQVAEQLEHAIRNGDFADGERIANEVDLAGQLRLARPTLRQAIQLLVDKGLLVRKRGVGTQVVHGRIHRPVELSSLWDDLKATGQTPTTEVLGCELVEASAEHATELRLHTGDPVWSVERLRLVDGEPLAVMHNVLPGDAVDLSEVDLAETGLYETIRATGRHLRVAEQRIGARGAEPFEARLLGARKGAPLLTMTRTAYDDGGRPIEYANHVYRPDRYSFEITLVDR